MNKLKSQQGLTLVEVLAALVILGIVFVGIMTVFPQMTLFNNKTEAKLDTMNLARQEMALVTQASKWEKILIPSETDPISLEPEFLSKNKINDEFLAMDYIKEVIESNETTPYTTDSFIRYQKELDYLYEIDIYLQCEAFLLKEENTSVPGTTVPCAKEDRIKLHKVHLKVFSNHGSNDGSYRLSSETYSYIRFIAKKPSLIPEGG